MLPVLYHVYRLREQFFVYTVQNNDWNICMVEISRNFMKMFIIYLLISDTYIHSLM